MLVILYIFRVKKTEYFLFLKVKKNSKMESEMAVSFIRKVLIML